jgi:hypothetical protein
MHLYISASSLSEWTVLVFITSFMAGYMAAKAPRPPKNGAPA